MFSNKPIAVTAQEEKEIHTTFEHLCDYPIKIKLKQELHDIESWLETDKAKSQQYAYREPSGLVQKSLIRKEEIEKELDALKSKPDKKISYTDISEMLKFLNHKMSKREIEEMMWEVDENLDGYIDWSEFRLMFNRNLMDQTGLEPNRMFNLAQFLIYDKNHNAQVSVDETMNLLYARYGRTVMEQKLKELFGEDMHEFGMQGGEITFGQYLKSVERVQMNMFLETNRGKRAKGLEGKDSSNNSKSTRKLI